MELLHLILERQQLLTDGVDYESKAVTVTAERKNTTIGYSYNAVVTATESVDTDNNTNVDTVQLTFDKAVTGAEAADFTIGGTKATSVSIDGRKVIIKFPETGLLAVQKLTMIQMVEETLFS